MLRALLPALAFLALAFAACDSDEESVSSPTPPRIGDVATPTPAAIAGAITICGRIGVPGEATPSSPTPIASCGPGTDFAALPGIVTTVSEAPPLPSGLTALTRYIEFEPDDPETGAIISMPLIAEFTIGHDVAWYTNESGQWSALDVTPIVHHSTTPGQDTFVEASFDPLPPNLVLLTENPTSSQ